MTVSESAFNEAVGDIDSKQRDITGGIDQCIEKYNNFDWGCWDDLFNQDLIDKVEAALGQLRDLWQEFAVEFAQLASPGNPFWFYEARDSWLRVKELVSGQDALLTDARATQFPATESWGGPQGAWYRIMPGVQASAMGGVTNHAGALVAHLGDHGRQIIGFWFDIANAFIDYAQLVGTEVANYISADPTKWLDIVSEIVGTISALIEFVQQMLARIFAMWEETERQMMSLENELADLTGSIAGQWPTVENLA